MANCPNCGSELNGPYCNTCGARAPEERSAKKAAKAPAARPTQGGKGGPGLFSSQRIGKTTAMAVLGLALFGAGTFSGYYIGTSNGGGAITSSSVDATAGSIDTSSQTPLGLAGQYMDEGVEYLNKGDRATAATSFRKAIAQYEQAVKADPNNLYARSYLGLTYYYVGDSKKALELEQAVLKQDDKYLWAIFNMAWMYETSDKKDESLLMYKKYLAVVDEEKQNTAKYAEQYELIDKQIQASKNAVANAEGGTKK
jgi:hypothetical protein